MVDDDMAVKISGGSKHYGRGSLRVAILDKLDMNVPRGTIYALLGASGCGKTTLLSCVVGQLQLNSGEIIVLGGKPGTKNSGVPGPRVGFMPQELGLMLMFTVKETIFYFGWLFGMSNEVLQERYEYLKKLLQLPPGKQMVKHLSGGQQRRVSIAAALVHGPELLIMDEPTVGLDPVLRDLIWKHLVATTRNHNVTVIITTHYIEEAKQAHQMGLMRQGKLLAEDTPTNLMVRFKCSSLETVFLRLSIRQSAGHTLMEACEAEAVIPPESAYVEPTPSQPEEEDSNILELKQWSQPNWKRHQPPLLHRMKPLILKNLLSILRCNGELLQSIVMPVMILALCYVCIGRYPSDLKFAVINDEIGNHTDCEQFMKHNYVGATVLDYDTCHFSAVSCLYLSHIDTSIATKVYFKDQERAKEAFRSRNVAGILHFSANFSDSLQSREQLGRYASPSIVNGSQVLVTLDQYDIQIYYLIQQRLMERFRNFAHDLSERCNRSIRIADVPMQFLEPVYGESIPKLQSYIAPRGLILTVFVTSTTVSSATIVNDRTSGVWGRNLVAGVSLAEILASHMLFQMALAVLYTIEGTITIFLGFGEMCRGNVFTMLFTVYQQSVCGACYGLLISVLSKDYIVSTFLTVGSFVPLLIFCGLVWPIEGMYFLLTKLCMVMPTTISTFSLNHILQKGWSITKPAVYGGFLGTFGWISLLLLASLVVLRIKG